jgi:hypothetical protein
MDLNENIKIEDFKYKGGKTLQELKNINCNLYLVNKPLYEYLKENPLMFIFMFYLIYIMDIGLFSLILSDVPDWIPSFITNRTWDGIIEYELKYNRNENIPIGQDILYIYGNSLNAVILDCIKRAKERIQEKMETVFNDIIQKLDTEKQNDINGTYCTLHDSHYCHSHDDDCNLRGSAYCTLTHNTQAWENLRDYINDKNEELKQAIEDETATAYEEITKIINLRLFYKFILLTFAISYNYIEYKEEAGKIRTHKETRTQEAIKYILYNGLDGTHREILIKKLSDLMDITLNNTKVLITRMKKQGLIKENDKKVLKLTEKAYNYFEAIK